MAKKKKAEAEQHEEGSALFQGEQAPEQPEPQPAAPDPLSVASGPEIEARLREDRRRQRSDTISGAEAVRRLLAEDPSLTAKRGVPLVKERFKIEMTEGSFAANKTTFLKQQRESGEAPSRRPQREQAPTRSAGPAVGTDPLEAARAVKELVDRYGAETVKGLADLFGSGA